MLTEFDIGLFSLHKNHVTHNFPGKLLGYMVHNLPILGSINPDNDIDDIITQSKSGFVSVNGDNKAFSENALKLIRNPQLRFIMGQNSRKLLNKKFSVKSALEKILKDINE